MQGKTERDEGRPSFGRDFSPPRQSSLSEAEYRGGRRKSGSPAGAQMGAGGKAAVQVALKEQMEMAGPKRMDRSTEKASVGL